ncbi:glycosyltransferase family 2 protein [Thermomonospora umbrina]|uniref:Glycosyltransferase involved in cell wall biosynthesis n=1 Tax=Thermomonospora umbrina TaxID=111806 RepID=A0A3D9SZH1_9ACTN|nr:glycosyltransferase family 2 protein [Thermomonospora umbrina]REE98385.1 glycosyltransferase involved in cell wall biosynthesis [Thermomonospora umbrina]
MTTLSVIVPMHNVAPYIGDLLISLERNVRDDFEFIFVDDGSSDHTGEIVERHRSRLPGFTVVRHAKARGLSAARNAGVAASSGRLITYLDGDDWIGPGYLGAAVEAIEALGCDFIKTDHVRVYGRRREVHRAPQGVRGVVLNPRDGILPVLDNTMVDYPNAWSGIYRRTLVDKGLLTFDEHLLTCEDRPWTWRLMRGASSYAVVSLFGVFYRREVAGSLTQIGDERQLHYFDAFDQVLADLADDPERDRFHLKALRTYCQMISFHLQQQSRLAPDLRRRQRERAVAFLRGLPHEDLHTVMPILTRRHQEALHPLLPAEVAR